MCLSIPYEIIKINKNKAKVKKGRRIRTIDIFAVPKAKIGDWVLVAGGSVVKKISPREAKEILSLIKL